MLDTKRFSILWLIKDLWVWFKPYPRFHSFGPGSPFRWMFSFGFIEIWRKA